MKQAILVISFGTTHPDALRRSIDALERSIGAVFPQCPLFRAFLSPGVRIRLEQKHGLSVPGPEEALEALIAAGFEAVTVQPTLMIPGEEYDGLIRTLHSFRDRISVSVGLPLLWQERDLEPVLQILLDFYHPAQDEVLLLMGHGTEHPANRLYTVLEEKMRHTGGCQVRLCTVRGRPTFAEAAAELRQQPLRRVFVAPLMLVAGTHVRKDMAGDLAYSLCALLEREGFTVECSFVGLGELEAVRQLYCCRALQAQPL